MFKKKYLGIITKNVVTASGDTTAGEIARIMRNDDIGVVVIVREGKVVGIVSERDIARRVVANNLPIEKVKAKDFMTQEVISIQLKDGLNKLYQKLYEAKFRHLLVLDEDKLIGITSRRDLLEGLSSIKKHG